MADQSIIRSQVSGDYAQYPEVDPVRSVKEALSSGLLSGYLSGLVRTVTSGGYNWHIDEITCDFRNQAKGNVTLYDLTTKKYVFTAKADDTTVITGIDVQILSGLGIACAALSGEAAIHVSGPEVKA